MTPTSFPLSLPSLLLCMGHDQLRVLVLVCCNVQSLPSCYSLHVHLLQSPSVSDDTLITIADVLAVLASTESGREYILRGGNTSANRTTRSVQHNHYNTLHIHIHVTLALCSCTCTFTQILQFFCLCLDKSVKQFIHVHV